MYSSIFLTHRIIVTLFLLQYIIKLALLLMNKKEALAKYSKVTRVPEMIVSAAFLVTGIWMLVQLPSIPTLMIVKLVCVFASIPIAIIGFKKSNKALATLAVVLILAAYGLAEMSKKGHVAARMETVPTGSNAIEIGKSIYTNEQCNSCHGEDGKLNAMGAKDLSVTTLSPDEQKSIIKNGKGSMFSHPDLNEGQLDALVQYIGTFKK